MARSIPGWSQTRHTRPSRCCTVIPSKGSVSPYSGWVGSMISTVSVGRAVSPIGVFSSVGLEEHPRIDGRSPAVLIGAADQVADEAQVQLGLEVPIEVARRHQILDGTITERRERTRFRAHYEV